MESRPCKITMIDLHHTDGHESNIEEIRNEHMVGKGWGDIGYNAVVFPNGSIPTLVNSDGIVATGRSLKWSGAHNPGLAPDHSGYTMNQRSFGLSHVGNFMADTMSEVQFQSSVKFCAEKCKEFGIIPSISTIRRHKDDYPTECPGDNFPYNRYIQEVIKLYNNQGDEEMLEVAVLMYTKEDYWSAEDVSVKNGYCAMFVRPADHSVPKDAWNAKHLIVVGGSTTGHPNETLLSGNDKYDTADAVKKYLG